MFQHHLLLIYRNFKRYKSSFFINLIGLSAGLSCALLIYLWVNDEMGMDRFHEKGKRLYQVMEHEKLSDGITTSDATTGILAQALATELPAVENAVTTSPSSWLAESKVSVNNSVGIKARGKFAGQDFFKVFTYPLLAGNRNQLLRGKDGIVISEELANKLFHTTAVLGKEMVWRTPELPDEDMHVQVTGVFKNIAENSSDQFDFLVSLNIILRPESPYSKWTNRGPNTFVVLKAGADPNEFSAKLSVFLKGKGVDYRQLFMRPYGDGYLYGKYENGVLAGGRIDYVRLFSLIAIFILLIACINFMNLSTAKASRRMKEVGIKKVMGAGRSSLIIQYLGESMLVTFLSLFVALLTVELCLPQFNSITDKHLSLHLEPRLISMLLSITLFTGLVSGSYPALYLSGFNPAAALKGKLSNTLSELWTRRGLVVFQFTLSVILIVSVFVVYKQIEFVQTKNLGFKKENVLIFSAEGKLATHVGPFIEALKQLPGVLHVSSMDRSFLGELAYTVGDFKWEGRDPKELISFQHAGINNDLIETLGMTLLAGRGFSSKYGADSTKMMINEAGIRAMRIKDPIGKIFSLWGVDYQIVGVVKDFNFESLHENVKPLFFRYQPAKSNRILVRIKAGEERATVEGIKDFYRRYNPGFAMDYKFLDQDFQAQYSAETRVAVLSRYFAGLAIVISCLGLFGLAAFTAERKIKEIGIRKVLGATEMSIVYILSKEFIKPVLASVLIALPVSYLMTSHWLNTFAYRIELQVWYFIAAGVLALMIALLTVSMQAIKAAGMDPINCLRDE